ncbi:MAG: nucleotide exchange factor GrpE [Treponema sp.]|jgi:molecular chaperone GrpE|nr:nucleotide exchange factor GrpE [Treponema sp.]
MLFKKETRGGQAGHENPNVEAEKAVETQEQGQKAPEKEQKTAESSSPGAGSEPQASAAPEESLNSSQETGAEPQNDAAAEKREPAPAEKIAGLEAQLAETHDQLLRKAADFENFRKRMNQEKQNAIEFANQSLLLDIIPIIDDFERAIAAGEKATDLVSFLDGVKMIEKRLSSQLESKWGLKRFNSAGEPFDPNIHEALMMEKSPDVKEAVVEEDLYKGYFLKDRVIRAAKVKVLMPETPGDV